MPKKGNKKVTISTINSVQAKLRQVYSLSLKEGWSMEAIMIPNMKLRLKPQVIPDQWQDLDGVWADQDTYGVAAEILLGADQAILFPHAVKDSTGALCQLDQARLMQSEITGNYIIFRSCRRHSRHTKDSNPWIRSNQFQESESSQSDEEIVISIMGSVNLDDAKNIQADTSSD